MVTPNPASNYFSLENNTNFDLLEVIIFDTYGHMTQVQGKLKDLMKIDCSKFAPGLYFINISHPSGFMTVERVIVNH